MPLAGAPGRWLVCLWTALLAGCGTAGGMGSAPTAETLFAGATMGSAWTVKVVGPLPVPEAQLQAGIEARFEAVNQALSTYRADSALSRFNAVDTGDWVAVDPELAAVMAYALSLAEASQGAYDITVGPLVDLWGFGPKPSRFAPPAAADLAAARARVGWRKVQVDVANSRARKDPGVRVDLSSLGKGRGVDRVAEYLAALGVTHYLIDLSGKLRASGHSAVARPWRVAVEQPVADVTSGGRSPPPAVVELTEGSVATAGDYRRFFEAQGRHYSHLIDPRSGEPVAHATASATVLAPDCLQADALATVLMVMPPEEALALADRHGWPALLVERGDAESRSRASAAWPNPPRATR